MDAEQGNGTFRNDLKLLEAPESVVIGGCGPVGLYTALRLLQSLHEINVPLFHVKIYDPIKPYRGNVIRIPFSIAASLPVPLRYALWPISDVRNRIFGAISLLSMWEEAYDYKLQHFIEIADFQIQDRNYLEQNFGEQVHFFQMDRRTAPSSLPTYPCTPHGILS